MLYAKDFRQMAREALRGHWGLAIGTGFVAGLFGASSNYMGSAGGSSGHRLGNYERMTTTDIPWIFSMIIFWVFAFLAIYIVITIIFGGAIRLGYCRFNLNLINQTEPRFNDLFSRFHIFWKAFGLQFLTSLYIMLWTLLFVIPGIIKSFSYSMAPYILEEDPSLGVNEAITLSREMMDGNKWRYFCLNLSFIGWAILCLFTFGIGFFWLTPYVAAANAAFYREISGKN